MIVKDIMKREIASIDGEDTIYDASKIYRDLKVGSVLITINKKLVGIVTERDFIERAICNVLDVRKVKIKEIMSTDVKTIDPSDRINDALEIMKHNKIKKLPVVQSGELVGIITITDIAYSRPNIKRFLDENKIMIR